MAHLIRVQDENKQFDWPADAITDGMSVVDGYPPNLTSEPRPAKPLVPLGTTPDAPSARTGSTLAAQSADTPKE